MQNRLLYSALFSLFCLPVITSAQQYDQQYYKPLTPQEQQHRQQQQQHRQQQEAPAAYHPPVQYFAGQHPVPNGQPYLQYPYAPQQQFTMQPPQTTLQQGSALLTQAQQPQTPIHYTPPAQYLHQQQPQVPSEEEQAHSIIQQAFALLAQLQKTQAQYLHQQNPPSALNPQAPVREPSASLTGIATVAGSLVTQSHLPQLHSPARGNTFKPSGEVRIFFEQNYTKFPILIAVIEDGDSIAMILLHQLVPKSIKVEQKVNFYQVKKNTEGEFFKINTTNKLLSNNNNNYNIIVTFAQDLVNNNPNALQYWQQINEDVYQPHQTSQLNPNAESFTPTQGQVQQQQNSTNKDNKTDRKIEQIGRLIEQNGQKLPEKPQDSVPVRSIEQKATNNIDGEILDLKKTKDNLVKKINSLTNSNGEKFEPFHYLKTYNDTQKIEIKDRLIGDIERLEESLKIITKQKNTELEKLRKENAELKEAEEIRRRALAEQEKRKKEAEEERQQREAQIAQENSNKKKEQLEQICNNQKPQTPPGIIVLPEQQQVKKQEEEQKKQQEKQKAPNQSPTHPTRTQTQQERISLVTIMKEQEEEKTEAEKRKKQESGQQLQEKNNTNPQKQNFAAAVSNTNKKRQEEEDQKLAQKLQEEENKKQKEQERLEQQNQRNLQIAEQRAHAPKNVRTSIDEKNREKELKKREQERKEQQAQHNKALAKQIKKEKQEQEQQKREEQAKKDKAKAAQKAAQQTTGKNTKKNKKETEKTEEELLAEIKKEWEIRDQEEEQKRKEKEKEETIRKEETTKAPQSQAQPERQIYVIDISSRNLNKIMQKFRNDFPNLTENQYKKIEKKVNEKIYKGATGKNISDILSINI